jgi:glyoxylase-like metal-dependent hydrolase (beta-lactamase superfamily II)
VGIGNRWDPKWRSIYHIDADETLDGTLREAGVSPEEVTHVVASHCHWDHIGSAIVECDGEHVPLFPNARHFAPAIEVQMAKTADQARKGSYRPEDVELLERLDLLETFDGVAELLPGLRAHVLGGHSDGVSVVTINEDEPGETAIFWSDVVPTTHHVQPPFIMAYDIDVVRSFSVRSEWLARAEEAGWIGLFYHDVDVPFARLERANGRYAAVPVTGA